ncbi:uncharacterized protein LOC135225596 [Macrobrachium nipponense]|uniref:uncharacterized protein LOC135225596 n=1 Tax=Macrobrachium nipponense TaxID=159736 RepID=UPI0030C7D11F
MDHHNMNSTAAVPNGLHFLEGHKCPLPTYGMLPSKISDYAAAGRVKDVFEWIERGGDINASDDMGQTLLHVACQEQQEEVLKKLLEHPGIHFNPTMNPKMGLTPVGIAASLDSTRILEILLSCAKSQKCVLSHSFLTEKGQKNVRTSTIIAATQNHKWEAVRLLLQHYEDMTEWEAFHVFGKSLEGYQYDIAETVILGHFPFREQDFSPCVQDLYYNKRWSLLEATFSKNVRQDNDSCLRVFHPMFVRRDWANVEKYLRLLNGEATVLRSDLVENVCERNKVEVARILETYRDDEGVATGALLAACVGGTSEEIAELLLRQEEGSVPFSDRTLDNAFLLASMFHSIEFIQSLLLVRRFSLKMLLRTLRGCKNPARSDVMVLISKLLDGRVKEFSDANLVDKTSS